MNLISQNCINFKAKYISSPDILKRDQTSGEYKVSGAKFVEIDPKNQGDREAILYAVEGWRHDLYGKNIANCMKRTAWSTEKEPSDKYYAITTQKGDVSKLEPDKIQALTHVFETKKRVKVHHLQVHPDLIYYLEAPEYKHIGKGMIDGLKEKYFDHSIILTASSTAINFYEKQGFEHEKGVGTRMIWNKEAEENSPYKDEYW